KYDSNGSIQWTTSPFTTPLQNTYGNSIHRMFLINGAILVDDSKLGFKTISIVDGVVLSSDSLVGNGFLAGDNSMTGTFTITDVTPSGNGFEFSTYGRCGYVTVGNLTLDTNNDCPSSSSSNDLFLVANSSEAPVQFASPVARHTLSDTSPDVELFPNPAQDQLNINLPVSEKEITLFIQNQFGRTVWSEKFESFRRTASITLDEYKFPTGIYYLIWISNGEVRTQRFIIEK
ncbi:MAG TPA: T9SS type A sorting domain-containing protein, partial [Saprospiraceae bacterium]|nr:T9SS type A sorting domain-containing protein [Saprospiraceae bacterium]